MASTAVLLCGGPIRGDTSPMRLPYALLVSAVLLAMPGIARAAEIQVSPGDDVEAAANALVPGDVLILADGTYELDGRFGVTVVGTEDAPITIRAADGAQPHFNRATSDQNIVDFDVAEHVVIRGIEFSGGSAGVRFSSARFVTFEDNEIHDTADVALRANDVGQDYAGFRILRNHIHHTSGTGEGMYLGCNNDGCRLTGALIEGNWVHHTNQPGIEQGDGIEIKEGGSDNIVRDNVIHDTNYPCILTYANAGNGGVNIIERNVMWNCGDHAIQTAADAIIRNNIILSAVGNGIAMQPHQSGAPQNLTVVHNTVLHPSTHAIRLSGVVGSVVIANNALYSQGGNALFFANGDASGVTVVGNVGTGGVSGIDATIVEGDLAADFVAAHHLGAPPIDLYPAAGSALLGAGDPRWTVADDVDCRARDGVDAGAYGAIPGGAAGWTVQEGFKTCADEGGGDDTSGGGDDTSGGGLGTGADDTTAGGGADDPSGGDSVTAGDGTAETAGGTGGIPADGDGDGGCGCTTDTPRARGWLWLPLLVFARRRGA